jgi:hypothetical protein
LLGITVSAGWQSRILLNLNYLETLSSIVSYLACELQLPLESNWHVDPVPKHGGSPEFLGPFEILP